MNVILFGATGMVGQGVLRECLLDPDVQRVETVGRTATSAQHAKLREVVRQDMWHYAPIEDDLSGFDACFFCLGVSSAGMTEADYERVTFGITMAAAEILSRLNPNMTFIYVSGAGTDSSERGPTMWARVKGKTENAQPPHGVRSKTPAYRVLYSLTMPLLPLLRRMLPGYILTTEQLGRAMLAVAKRGAPKRVLESQDISAIASA
jgi:nucleoside-diphosphate-sugar epimerase